MQKLSNVRFQFQPEYEGSSLQKKKKKKKKQKKKKKAFLLKQETRQWLR